MPIEISSQQAADFILARQHISLPASDPLEAVRRMVVVQTQYEANLPVAVWARTHSLQPGWAERALLEERSLVKVWTLRSTLHVQTSADLPLLVSAIGRVHRERMRDLWVRYLDRTPEQVDQIFQEIRAALSHNGPMTRKQLHEAVPLLRGTPYTGWGVDVKDLAYAGELVFADAQAGQKRFALRERWLPMEWFEMDEQAARHELLRRYLRAYGPANLVDFARWAGRGRTEVRPLTNTMAAELVEVQVSGWPGSYLALAEDEAELRAPQPEPPAAALLPKFEALVLAYSYGRFYDMDDHTRINRPAGQIEAVVLLHGRIAGTWRLERKNKRPAIRVMPFKRPSKADRKALLAKMSRLADFLQLKDPLLEVDEEGYAPLKV
jgi:hypothetical protein